MEIAHWPLAQAGRLADFFARQMAPVPYWRAVTAADFARQIAASATREEILREQVLVVAQCAGRVSGYAHLALQDDWGRVRFLAYEPGHRRLGQRLLDESERYFAARGVGQVSVWANAARYACDYLGHGLPDGMDHVAALLLINGYAVDSAVQVLQKSLGGAVEPAAPAAGAEITIERDPPGGARPSINVVAALDGAPVGGVYADPAGAEGTLRDCTALYWIGVEEQMRGRGWGRYLLEKLHCEMAGHGFARVYTTCGDSGGAKDQGEGLPARLLFANAGYRPVGARRVYVKKGI